MHISETCLSKPSEGSEEKGQHESALDRCSSPLFADAVLGNTEGAALSRKPSGHIARTPADEC